RGAGEDLDRDEQEHGPYDRADDGAGFGFPGGGRTVRGEEGGGDVRRGGDQAAEDGTGVRPAPAGQFGTGHEGPPGSGPNSDAALSDVDGAETRSSAARWGAGRRGRRCP